MMNKISKLVLEDYVKWRELFSCPKCEEIFTEVNGLLVQCKCGYVEDSTFNQITNWEDFKLLHKEFVENV